VDLWNDSSDVTPVLGRTYDRQQQHTNGGYCDRIIASIERALIAYPTQRAKQDKWRSRMAIQFRRFCRQCLGYTDELLDVMFTPESLEVTRDFVHQATFFDRDIDIDDLHQALRNVWVMNSIQMLLGLEVRCSSSVFAYSMLYPYTDNYLDDALPSAHEKRLFNRWLEQRLQGTRCRPRNRREHDLSQLVQLIEDEHKRLEAQDVYHSLLAIHAAQDNSLRQQVQRAAVPDADLLEISVKKGGTSVLAHGYLVNQTLEEDKAEFLFGYGVFLQLMDDLQDVARDTECRHTTLFTETSRRDEPLDRLSSRLHHFMQNVLRRITCFPSPGSEGMQELIRQNCQLLMLQAIAQHHQRFSRGFLGRLESYSPLDFAYLRRCPQTIQKSHHRTKRAFAKRHDNASIYSVLG
jgi:hypothetical protein